MIQLGVDSTIGSGTIQSIIKNLYENEFNNKEKSIFMERAGTFMEFQQDKSNWLIPLLAEYHYSPKLYDAMSYTYIADMILKGHLFMALLPLDNFASPDKEVDKNVLNVTSKYSKISIDVLNSNNSDGIVDFEGKLEFTKLMNGDVEPDNESITLEDFNGTIEFGTQDISKTAMSLKSGSVLFRVPYNSFMPVLAVFKYLDTDNL
tara:strand:+ start:44 stop:658 length:615 start_codon:yes stop_codon:yes gene_type:complete